MERQYEGRDRFETSPINPYVRGNHVFWANIKIRNKIILMYISCAVSAYFSISVLMDKSKILQDEDGSDPLLTYSKDKLSGPRDAGEGSTAFLGGKGRIRD